jgi:thymidine phosphorylase
MSKPKSDERYEVYVRSGKAAEKFREFCATLGDKIEIEWKDTVEF